MMPETVVSLLIRFTCPCNRYDRGLSEKRQNRLECLGLLRALQCHVG